MPIKIIKRGTSKQSNKKFIVIETTGKTKIDTIINRFGKNYNASMIGASKYKNGKYRQVLWKRAKPLKSLKEIGNTSYW